MFVRRPIALALASLLSVGASVAVHVPARGATTWEFPGPDCSQSDGLQACIDKTAAGDTIELTQDPLNSQFGTITHSLTVKPTPGFEPTLGQLEVDDGGTAAPMAVDIEGLSLLSGLATTFTGGTGHSLVIRDVHVRGHSLIGGSGISLTTSVPSSFHVIDTEVVVTLTNDEGIGLFSSAPSGLVTLQAIGNRISAPGVADSVEAIAVSSEGSGSVRADILNNVITDVMSCNCGMGTAITFDPAGTTRMRANVVGNTIDHLRPTNPAGSASGIGLRTETTGAVSLNAFNNVFSDLKGEAFSFENRAAPNEPAVHTGYNDYFELKFGDGVFGRTAGSHNLHEDPKFLDATHEDLRLRASSPLIDAGQVCSPGGVANMDAAGHGRLHGSSVDLGGYERGAGSPTGVAFVGTSGADQFNGTSGDDIICGYGGKDTLNGEAGDDYIDGGTGNDTLTGGPGSDRLFGEAGNDTLCARDGTHGNDQVNGGPGTDGYRVDPGDAKAAVEHTASC